MDKQKPASAPAPDSTQATMRLDKWLWGARFFKTRNQARDAIRNGRVREGGQRIKPSRSIRPGDRLDIRRGPFTHTVTVMNLTDRRLPAADAIKLYTEDRDSIERREQLALQLRTDKAGVPRPRGRPDKRKRRELIRFLRHGD